MDFLVKVEGRPVFAVEAKDLNADLSAHVTQLGNYANAEGIRWGILTNAQEIRVYDQRQPGKPAEKLVLKIDLTRFENDAEYDAVFKDFWRLSKGNEKALEEVVGEARLNAAMRTILADTSSSTFKALRKGVQASLERKVSPEEIQMWLSTRLGTIAPSVQGTPAAGEQTTQPPKPRHFEAYLKQMIQRGIIPANAQVSAEYGGQEHTAVIDGEGYLLFEGERFHKPGFAAKRITGTPTDGFEFWKYQGEPLARLRDKLWQN